MSAATALVFLTCSEPILSQASADTNYFGVTGMWWRAIVAGLIVGGVSELADRFPRLGALLLTLPVVSIVAFIAVWNKEQDMATVSRLARETLVLVPLGLPLFVPLAFSDRFGLGFWPRLCAGIVLASAAIGLWFWLGPQTTD